MKVYMKPVRMIAYFEPDGLLTPIKFQMSVENQEPVTIPVNKIIVREEEKLAGNRMIIYKCQSLVTGTEKAYELKYELSTCKWYLYKM